jgi:hypothetical protein
LDIKEIELKYQDVMVLKESVKTAWCHVNNIYALLNTFKVLIEKDCDWIVTLSANCFPIKSVQQIESFFNHAESDLYLEHFNVTENHFDFYMYFRNALYKEKLFEIPYFNSKFELKKKIIRKKISTPFFSSTYIPFHGSDWYFANKKAVKYLFEEMNKVEELCQFLSVVNATSGYTICPPEIVFHTIWKNSNLFSIDKNNYRYINWEGAKNWHPNTLDESYWTQIVNSSALFARKFDNNQSMSLVNRLLIELNK